MPPERASEPASGQTPERHYKLVIEYDGSAYHGWQRQKDAVTIQETIEKAICLMTGGPVRLIASGRTDAGVHALGQVASFSARTRIPPEQFHRALNRLLPDDIAIHRVEAVSSTFHARYDAVQKTYRYHIRNHPFASPIGRHYRWHVTRPLDLGAMAQAAALIEGTHDFRSFEATGSPRSHTNRTVYSSHIQEKEKGDIVFTITANGFLRYMVRNIVGTLVDVGLGKIRPEAFGAILSARDRRRAGVTAPPQGLFLVEVVYGEKRNATGLSTF